MKRLISLALILTLCISLFVPVMAAEDADIGKETVIEAGSSDFTTEGTWKGGSSLLTPSGTNTWYTSAEGAKASYALNVDPGTYEIYCWKIVHKEKNDTSLEATISYNGQTANHVLDFSKGSSEWLLLGTYYLNGDGTEYVKFARAEGTSEEVITRTGAVKLIKKGGEIASASQGGTDEVAAVLALAGVTNGVNITNDTAPTRAEFVKLALSVMGYESIIGDGIPPFLDVPTTHPYYGVIAAAIDMGIIHGNGQGYFRPEDPVTYLEAVKIMVCTLGYEQRAEYSGGWTAGYLGVASSLDLTDGVSEPFTGKEAKTLLFNALMAGSVDLSAGDMKFKPMDTPVLEEVHGIAHDDGVVLAAGELSITDTAAPGEDHALIGDTKLKDLDSLTDSYIGQSVTFYYTTDNNTLVLITEAKNNEVVDISSKDILSVEVDGDAVIVDYDDGGKTRTIRTAAAPAVVYNGQILKSPYNKEDFDIESGMLRFVGKSNCDVLIVYDYDVYVVNSVNKDSETIYPKYRPDNLKLGDALSYKLLNDKSGKEMSIDTLKEWTVLNVLNNHSSQTKGAVTVRISNRKVTGTVSELVEDKVVIDDKEYELSDDFVPFAGELVDPAVIGSEVTVYLDMTEHIVAADYSDPNRDNYIYAHKIRGQQGLDGNIKIKAFTAKGVWEEIPVADKVKYNGKEMSVLDIIGRDEGLIDTEAFDDAVIPPSEEHYIYSTDENAPVTFVGEWKASGSSTTVGPESQGSFYARNDGDSVTYSTAALNKKIYDVYYWSAALNSINPMGIEVVDSNGTTDTQSIDEINGRTENKTWSYVGRYTLGGGAGNVTFFIEDDAVSSSTAKPTLRTVGIRLAVPGMESDPQPADYINTVTIPIDKPLYVERNSKGEIKTIDTLTEGTAYQEWRYYSSNKAFIDSTARSKIEFVIDSDTMIFSLPADREDTDAYSVEAASSLANETEYNMQAYELDDMLCAKFVIMANSGDVTLGNYHAIVVNRVSKSINSDGEDVYAISGYQNGSEVKLTGADEKTFYNVAAGDVIVAVKNKDGYVNSDTSGYTILLDSSNFSAGQTNNLHNNYSRIRGTVTEVYEGGKAVKIDIGSEERIYYLTGANTYIYDSERGKILVGAIGDVAVGDKIFVRIRRTVAREVVLYR